MDVWPFLLEFFARCARNKLMGNAEEGEERRTGEGRRREGGRGLKCEGNPRALIMVQTCRSICLHLAAPTRK